MTIHSRIPSQALAAPAPLTQTLRIAIEHLGKGRYRSTDFTPSSPTCGRVIVEHAREPLFDSARALIALGHDPEAILEMSRAATPETIDMRGRLRLLAKLAVHESATAAPSIVRWKPSPFNSICKDLYQ